jgi:predicted amidohydrolase YtcJ
VTLALGSEAPVAPLDPWLAMAAAVHRSGDAREPWNPAESLTAAQALAASTDGRITLTPGGPGDVVLLDDDPLHPAGSADPVDTAAVAAHLRGVRVAATVVAGRPTYLDL